MIHRLATHDKRIVNERHKRVIALKKGEIVADRVGGWAL